MTPAAYVAVCLTLAATAAAFLAGSMIEKPRNIRDRRLRRWLKINQALK